MIKLINSDKQIFINKFKYKKIIYEIINYLRNKK